MTPEHLTINQKAVLDRIEKADIDEPSRMFFRTALERGLASTNGRTYEEKIQDLTEQFQTILQLNISRELISREIDTKIEKTSDDVLEVKEDISELKSKHYENKDKIDQLVKDHESGGKFDYTSKEKSNVEVIGDTVKDAKWALCVLGLGICCVFLFRPEIAEFLKNVFN